MLLGLLLLLVVVGCSPEAERSRGGGPGADVGNVSRPVEMHGDQRRNNPEYQTPALGRAPADARGVPGWWASGAR